ncbi:MAG: outer membrane beta-barrel protein [Acidobacteriota bacterium]
MICTTEHRGLWLRLLVLCGLLGAPVGAQDEPWTLFPDSSSISAGGWLSAGYHSESNDLFNSQPEELELHQAWLFAEKSAANDDGSLGFGFRVDVMYGIDAGDTQAFGNEDGWDTTDTFQTGGGYGYAIPQAYIEIAANNWSVKAGHFYTLIGYEVVTAPDNFFYSHAITMYNSEPFTHTGVLASFASNEDTTWYAGWTLGWDTGFDQFEDGGNFLGGVGTTFGEKVGFTYITTVGDFGARGDEAYSHSLLFDIALSDSLNWVIQSDFLTIDSTGEENLGLNQYLFYTLNDAVALGARLEWWQGDDITGYAPHGGVITEEGSQDYFEATIGANFKFARNFTLRPEIRYDWSDDVDYDETIAGVDLVFTF